VEVFGTKGTFNRLHLSSLSARYQLHSRRTLVSSPVPHSSEFQSVPCKFYLSCDPVVLGVRVIIIVVVVLLSQSFFSLVILVLSQW
jgi:hypothetical protein